MRDVGRFLFNTVADPGSFHLQHEDETIQSPEALHFATALMRKPGSPAVDDFVFKRVLFDDEYSSLLELRHPACQGCEELCDKCVMFAGNIQSSTQPQGAGRASLSTTAIVCGFKE
ncbi:hypothetical protein K438DRAFT_1774074 [Mycena galopus ATCC 62051]|nr:hypothetical protein K438DRAFT_1774074 [Mycena galopus ATCC 62051]